MREPIALPPVGRSPRKDRKHVVKMRVFGDSINEDMVVTSAKNAKVASHVDSGDGPEVMLDSDLVLATANDPKKPGSSAPEAVKMPLLPNVHIDGWSERSRRFPYDKIIKYMNQTPVPMKKLKLWCNRLKELLTGHILGYYPFTQCSLIVDQFTQLIFLQDRKDLYDLGREMTRFIFMLPYAGNNDPEEPDLNEPMLAYFFGIYLRAVRFKEPDIALASFWAIALALRGVGVSWRYPIAVNLIERTHTKPRRRAGLMQLYFRNTGFRDGLINMINEVGDMVPANVMVELLLSLPECETTITVLRETAIHRRLVRCMLDRTVDFSTRTNSMLIMNHDLCYDMDNKTNLSKSIYDYDVLDELFTAGVETLKTGERETREMCHDLMLLVVRCTTDDTLVTRYSSQIAQICALAFHDPLGRPGKYNTDLPLMRLVTVLACAAFFKDRTGLAVLPCIPPMSAYYEALIVYKDPTAMHLRQHIRVDVFYLFLQMCIVELRRVNGEEEVQARPFLAPLLIAQCESILWYQPETVKGRADCQLLQIQAYLMVLFPQLIAEAEERQRLTLIYVQTLCSMAARYHHRTLLRDIVTALGLLCHDNPEAQAVFRSAGGIVYVVEILRRMTNWSKPRIDPYVDCLWSATQNNSESSSVMRQCGGIFLLCDWIERSDAEVQTRIIRCLADLAEDRRNQEHMFAWRSKTDAGVGLCELLLTLAVREKMHLSSENRRWGGANSEGVYNLVLTILCFLENIKDKKFMYNMSQQENIAYLFSDGLNGRFATGFPALLQSCLTQNIVPTEYDAQFLVEMGQMYVDHHERVTSCLNQMAEKRTADALEGEATLKEVFRATFG